MPTKKHTIKECKALLRSCVSMLDALYGSSSDLNFVKSFNLCYISIAHILLISPESQVPLLFDRIVTLYNEINSQYLKL